MEFTCRICSSKELKKSIIAPEMMFGTRDKFLYNQCANCDCLQLEKAPLNLSSYYPENYYSFQKQPITLQTIRGKLLNARLEYLILRQNPIGWFMQQVKPSIKYEALGQAKLNRNMSILEIGSGSGRWLFDLASIGFKNLTGVDPFIEADIETEQVSILKKDALELEGQWDFIMLNHSFEHMPNPLEMMIKIRELMHENSTCMIRIPTVSSYAFEHYKENWIQLDAPRHLFLHSLKSMEILAKKANLKINNIYYDSTSFQFWGSEQYLMDIPLMDKNSYKFKKENNPNFTSAQIKKFEQQAQNLNKEGKGDAVAFYLIRE